MKNKLTVLIALIATTGCSTTITTPSGWKYTNRGFTKNVDGIKLKQSGSNIFELQVTGWKSEAQQMADAWAIFIQAAANAYRPGTVVPPGTSPAAFAPTPQPTRYLMTNNTIIPVY